MLGLAAPQRRHKSGAHSHSIDSGKRVAIHPTPKFGANTLVVDMPSLIYATQIDEIAG